MNGTDRIIQQLLEKKRIVKSLDQVRGPNKGIGGMSKQKEDTRKSFFFWINIEIHIHIKSVLNASYEAPHHP